MKNKGRYNRSNFFVITGGSGVGKTSILEFLKKDKYDCSDEVARKIIKEQQEIGGTALPWGDTKKYADLMFKGSVKAYQDADKNKITFFDRGIPDTLAYIHLTKGEAIQDIQQAIQNFRYNKTVFILPPWHEIYKTDSERKQNYEQAVLTYKVMVEVYKNSGYNLIEVPKISIEKRTEFIIDIMLSAV